MHPLITDRISLVTEQLWPFVCQDDIFIGHLELFNSEEYGCTVIVLLELHLCSRVGDIKAIGNTV